MAGEKRAISVGEARALVRRRSDFRHDGWSERELVRREGDGSLIRVRRSWLVESEVWNTLWPEGRHLLAVVAAASDMVGAGAAMSHGSAAVLWGLPLVLHGFDRVHVTAPETVRVRSTASVFRHADRITASDLASVEGIRCTSLERTVFDLMRTATTEAALSAADAALGRDAVVRRIVDDERERAWRERMRARAAGCAGGRGVTQARWLTEFADGRAELPGESVCRLQLHRLGYARPRLQVPVPAPGDGTYWLDLSLDDVETWMEFDGETKYHDAEMRDGRSPDEVLRDEKRREDWIRGTTGRPLVRVGFPDLRSPALLSQRLRSFHVPPPRRH